MATLIIQENGAARTRSAVNGEEITVAAPCNCTEVTGVQIAGVQYPFYDACGNNVSNIAGKFSEGSLIRVLIDTTNTRAQIINQASASVTNETKALFGLGADAVPDDVLAWLGQYNQHWWARRFNGSHYVEVLGELSSTVNIMSVPNSKYSAYAVYYYDGVSFDANGNFVLGTEHTVTFSYSESTSANVLKGKYFYETSNGTKITSTLYYMPSNAADVTQQIDGSWYRVRGSAQVVSKRFVEAAGEWEYVQAPERNRYPDTGVVDSVEYRYFVIPFDNAVTAPRIATGSYTGTGTYGESNPNRIIFDFQPKLVMLYAGTAEGLFGVYNRALPYTLLWGVTTRFGYDNNSSNINNCSYSGNTISWYCTSSENSQQNIGGATYRYVAIG